MEFPVIKRVTGIIRRKANHLEIHCGKSCLVGRHVGENGEVGENLFAQSDLEGISVV